MRKIFQALLFFSMALPLFAQAPSQGASEQLVPIPSFSVRSSTSFSITRDALPNAPFTVVGPRGAILGQQSGVFEAWIFPWKILSNMRIIGQMQDYAVPIDVNDCAATIEVHPGYTVITFSHANFTVREFLFAPQDSPAGSGAFAFFQIEAIRSMTLTFQFTAEMKRMWPALSDDRPSPQWVKTPAGGYYILHLNFPDHAAALEFPGAESGVLPPYQEKPKAYPLEFVLHFDPKTDAHKLFPLLLAVSDTRDDSLPQAFVAKLDSLLAGFQALFEGTQKYYVDFLSKYLTIETPDKSLDRAFAWAELAIDHLRIETIPAHDESALAAGFYSSGDSARPGFGWFFGRDALWSLYAVNGYGDFRTTRDELEFLIRRQRSDGKIIHEWAQTAALTDWASLPYEFASADATPLLLMATRDYFNISGDRGFVEKNWGALQKAWNFETSHDSDGDGIYENTEGSAWVESWPPGMPHQEIYLAALDQQASRAFANLARATGRTEIALQAEKRADYLAQQIEKTYFVPDAKFYAFSKNADGSLDSSATIFPAVAWWDDTRALANAGPMLGRWASEEFSTDWGTRDLSVDATFYDPISYHQGSVWPLFTGWVSLAEYRAGRPLSGYAHLMQNADLTWSQDLGAVTELLSGEFFRPLGRSTPHQLWSSAMVISPTLRGLFGLEWDAATNTIRISPQLPADWDHATLRRIPLGTAAIDLEIQRAGTALLVRPVAGASATVHLESRVPGSALTSDGLRIPLPTVEVGFSHAPPEPGAVTSQLKVLDQRYSPHSLTLQLSAPAGSTQTLFLRVNDDHAKVRSSDVSLPANQKSVSDLQVIFPEGIGFLQKTVTLSW
jgi:GH15 family glucan-1,4-alpha-glucosidase